LPKFQAENRYMRTGHYRSIFSGVYYSFPGDAVHEGDLPGVACSAGGRLSCSEFHHGTGHDGDAGLDRADP
jgi:hypothetical protein